MNQKVKQLSLVAIATSVALYGCSDDYTTPEKQTVADVGLWAPPGEIVQVVDSDFYPLTAEDKTALANAKAAAKAAAMEAQGEDFDDAAWEAEFKYEDLDLYAILGLTNEELGRQAIAKEEARAFKIDQGMQALFDDLDTDETFDEWFDAWFANVDPVNYLGAPTRLSKALRGEELGITSADDGTQVRWAPPTSCPNYQVEDPTGESDCITPVENPLVDSQPTPVYTAKDGEAVIYYRSANHNGVDASVYDGLTIHAWNNDPDNDPTADSLDCTAYTKDSTTSWGAGKSSAGVDPNYGMYWVLNLLEGHDNCGNIIVYNVDSGDKMISNTDLRLTLGDSSGPVPFANSDKNSYLQDGILPNGIDGNLYANPHPLLGAASGSKGCGWGTELNAAGDSCIGETLMCPEGAIAVGTGTVDIASKCIALFDPASTDLFLRGGFNGWGNEPEDPETVLPIDWNTQFEYVGDNVYRVNATYGSHPADQTPDENLAVNYGFKVADADWSESTSFGGVKGGGLPAVGSTIQVTAGNGVGQDMFIRMKEELVYQFTLDVTDQSAPQLSIGISPLDAFPTLTVGDETVDFAIKDKSSFNVSVNLEPGTYNVSLGGLDFGVAENTDLQLFTPVDLVADGAGAITFTTTNMDEADDYGFVIDATDKAKPTIQVIKPPLGNEPVFVRGTMTGWGDPAPLEDEMIYDPDSTSYSVVYGMSKDASHAFKFANRAWGGAVDIGYSGVTIADDSLALTDENGNIGFAPTKSTAYELKLTFTDSTTGELKVSEAPIYIRGGIYGTGDWGPDDTMRLHYDGTVRDAGHVYTSKVTTTGSGFFKIADADWGGAFGFNYGATERGNCSEDGKNAGCVDLGVPMTLTDGSDSQDINFPHPAGDYIFSFNHVTKELTITAAPVE